jgi:hypothetical protein
MGRSSQQHQRRRVPQVRALLLGANLGLTRETLYFSCGCPTLPPVFGGGWGFS